MLKHIIPFYTYPYIAVLKLRKNWVLFTVFHWWVKE